MRDEFKYVDVHWEDPSRNARSKKWRRIPLDAVAEFQQENANYNVFATIQQFRNKVHTKPEISFMPLYFDLDHEDVEVSQKDALRIVQFFGGLSLDESDISVYFSGKKGFHILVNPYVLGIEPHMELHRIFKYIALYLEKHLGLDSLDIGSIYSSRRMLRLPDSVHQSTGCFKVQLTHAELQQPLEEIKNLARSPRGILAATLDPQRNETAGAWYESLADAWYDSEQQKAKPVPSDIMDAMEDDPVCVTDLLNNGIKKSGDRNKATMALASYMKDAGYTQADAEHILLDWVMKIPKDMTSADEAGRKSSTLTATATIFNSDNYHFSCPYIRALKGENDPVPCAGRHCPLHEDHRKSEEEALKLHLSETARADMTGKKVSFDCLVSGKLDTPYIVPKKVVYTCNQVDTCDKECIMHSYAGRMEREFFDHDRVLIEATHQSDAQLKGILREYSRAACKKVRFDVEEFNNVEEMLVVPMAERVTQEDVGGEKVSVDETGNEYVARRVYVVNTKVPTNQYYEITGYIYPHPRNQFGTVLSQQVMPKQDNIAQFTLDDLMKKKFSIFQVQPGESVLDRLNVLLDDLTNNVTRIYKRDETLLATLLTYHSVLTFDFQEQRLKRGWLETILIGDSGQGKTALVQEFNEFAGLGELASGESSSRTGLIYRLEQLGERWFITWGKYPLNDRRLLIIDEISGLREEDLGKMTESRQTGVLKVDRAVNAETNARTRLLFMTNPRGGKQLSYYTHGIEALKSIFPEAADIRRLDLAIFLATKDVDKTILNKTWERPKEKLIESDVMKNSVLWAWSRKPEQVVFEDDAMAMILETAGYLGDKYGAAEDIPLVSPADQRIKLARLCVALAALLHSTDANHELVIVKQEHVLFIRDFLELVFDAKNCRYRDYANNAREETDLEADEADTVRRELSRLDKEDHLSVSQEVLELFRRNDVLKAQELQDMTGHTREIVNPRLAVLAKYNFLKRTREGFRKMPKFIEFLEREGA